jgi:hypothetical protein
VLSSLRKKNVRKYRLFAGKLDSWTPCQQRGTSSRLKDLISTAQNCHSPHNQFEQNAESCFRLCGISFPLRPPQPESSPGGGTRELAVAVTIPPSTRRGRRIAGRGCPLGFPQPSHSRTWINDGRPAQLRQCTWHAPASLPGSPRPHRWPQPGQSSQSTATLSSLPRSRCDTARFSLFLET